MATRNPFIGEDVADHVARERKASERFGEAFDAELARLELARAVRALREAEKLSQAELASRVGTKQPAIARLESGKVEPSLGLLWKIAGATGRQVKLSFEPATGTREVRRPRASRRRAR